MNKELDNMGAEEKLAYNKLSEMTVEQKFDLYEKHNDNLCEICSIRSYECNGLSLGPNSPLYPLCADVDFDHYINYEKLDDECLQIILDEIK